VSCKLTQIVPSTERGQLRHYASISDGRIVNTMSTTRVERNGNDGNPIPRTHRDTSDNGLLRSNKVSRVCGTQRRCPDLVTSRTPSRPRLKNVTQFIHSLRARCCNCSYNSHNSSYCKWCHALFAIQSDLQARWSGSKRHICFPW
jgi:hypothetical protein